MINQGGKVAQGLLNALEEGKLVRSEQFKLCF